MGGIRVVANGHGTWAAGMLVNTDLVRGWQGLGRVRDLLQRAQSTKFMPSNPHRSIGQHCPHRHRGCSERNSPSTKRGIFAEAQQISRTGSFSWRPATGEITWSGELYRIFELGRSWTRDQNGRLEYIGAVQDVTQRRLSAETLGKVRSELAHVARVTSLGAMTASIAHEVNQPLSGIITNASTCLRMLAADPPNVDGARETARRTISRWQSCL